MFDLLKHPSLRHADHIAEICSPLKKINISYFAHVRIRHDKKISAMSSNPRFMEHYLKNHYFNADIHRVDESKFGNFFVWDGIEFSGRSAKMCREAGEFGIHNPFTIIERNKNEIDYYHFANHSVSKQINQVYLANLDLLYLFISHFNDNIKRSRTLSKAHDFIFDLNSDDTIAFEDSLMTYDRSDFLNSIHHKKSYQLEIENQVLSKRQSEIVRLVVHGKTMKEIGKMLNLSPRTVGHYFETIKMKLNISTRSELISKTTNLLNAGGHNMRF
jgi:DNA-binding CsgD family transcriptional regulator